MRNALRDAGHRAGAGRLHQRARHVDRPWATRSRPWRIKRCFGEHAYKLAVSSTKSMTGHLLGGAGGLEAGITVLAIRDQIAPPTINYETPDPDCDLDYVPNDARPMDIEYALSNSFGFGGTNGCLIFKRSTEYSAGEARHEDRCRHQAGPARDSLAEGGRVRRAGSTKPISATRSTSRTPTRWKKRCS